MRRLLAVVLLAAGLAATEPAHAAQEAEPPCDHSVVPYDGVPGAALTPTDHVTVDVPPVRYTRWRGVAPGFDGIPLSVDVTVPCDATGPLPLVVMNHGFTDDKTVWEETGKSDSVLSTDRPATNSNWNNIWFASQGYVVLNHTFRGWRDSCGPDVPGAVPGVAPAPACAAYEYWIHLADKRWEVRDVQWLTGGLVQSGVADAGRLAVTGGSYGGAPTASAALLGGRTMCGGAAVPAELGPDPCAGRAVGDLVPWTTPDGSTPLTWRAAVPLYTFGDVIQVLAPNGRGSDGEDGAPPDRDHGHPFGIPLQSTVAGLLVAGQNSGFFAPPGVDSDSDIFIDAGRLLAGNPFPEDDPLVARGVQVYRDYKSPLTTVPVERVPIFWVQGFTDALFPAFEPLQVLKMVRAAGPAYPMKLFLGDVGHDYSGERADEWALVHEQMNAFLAHHLDVPGAPAPTYDVGATVTRCLNHDDPMRYESAPTWAGLHPESVTFTSTEPGVTDSATPGPAALATDPITTATLPLPGSYKGCRVMRPSSDDPTAATYRWPVDADLVLMGGPTVELTFTTTATDTELNMRVWDVAPDGGVQGLVTRGTYRSLDGPGTGIAARFQLWPMGYRLPAGHTLKLEVAANDAPYHQQSNIPAVVTVERVGLSLPLLERGEAPAAAPAPATTVPPATASPSGTLPATGGAAAAAVALLVLAAGLVFRRWAA